MSARDEYGCESDVGLIGYVETAPDRCVDPLA